MEKAIIITGAAGFIGSVLTGKLNQTGGRRILFLLMIFPEKRKSKILKIKILFTKYIVITFPTG